MLTAIILICSSLTTPNLRDCDVNNARTVMASPDEYRLPSACLAGAQQFLASTQIGRSMTADEHMKTICIHEK